MASNTYASYAVVGDVHGHLQLALCTLARWQRERCRPFSAVFLCGDVATFTSETQLDKATRRHAHENPCELEFLKQWSSAPQPSWLPAIFRPEPEGLGLCCPVVMVHGNHEGFAHLETLYPRGHRPAITVPLSSLPPVDPSGHLLFLPPGWTALTAGGHIVGGIGGMEAGQRRAVYHPMAYLEPDAVQHLREHAPPLDLLITHQGPARVQGEGPDSGSPTLDLLLKPPLGVARFWFHGHGTPVRTPVTVGRTEVVPLGSIAFENGTPGLDGWAILDLDVDRSVLTSGPPPFWRDLLQHYWYQTPRGLVHPDLVNFVE